MTVFGKFYIWHICTFASSEKNYDRERDYEERDKKTSGNNKKGFTDCFEL